MFKWVFKLKPFFFYITYYINGKIKIIKMFTLNNMVNTLINQNSNNSNNASNASTYYSTNRNVNIEPGSINNSNKTSKNAMNNANVNRTIANAQGV